MPSKKFSHRDSMVNQSGAGKKGQGGGNIKAGLAPLATNFMMGVKTNHKFDAHPVKTLKTADELAAEVAAALKARAEVQAVTDILAALDPTVLPADATEEQVAAAELLVRAQVSEVASVLSAMGASDPATEAQVAAAEAAVAAASS